MQTSPGSGANAVSSQHPRRGRPVTMPFDPSPPASPWFEAWPRIGWLLLTNRLTAHDGAFGSREVFVDRLRARGVATDVSRLSRWESGRHPVPGRVLTAYEALLDLPEGSLVALARTLVRAAGPRPAEPPTVDDDPRAPSLDELVDRASDRRQATAVTGSQWLRLATGLTRYDAVYLGDRVWSRLCDRLMSEMARTTGHDRLLRYEACSSLVRHPVAKRPVLRTLGSWLTDPDLPVADHLTWLLAEIDDEAASDLAVRLLTSPAATVADAAVPVVAVKVARGHLDAEALGRLEDLLVARARTDLPANPRLVDLLAQLPRERGDRVLAHVSETETRARLATQCRQRSLAPAQVARSQVRTLAARAHREVPDPLGHETDRMLDTLLHETLHDVHAFRRHLAAVTLSLSAYHGALAAGFVDLACGPIDPAAATRALVAVTWLGPRPHTAELTALLGDPTRPGPQTAAAHALGRQVGPLPSTTARALTQLATSTEHHAVRAGAASALGLRAPSELIHLAADHPALAPAARWWSRVGPVLDDSERPGSSSPSLVTQGAAPHEQPAGS